ncbi:MAG: thioredoxin family protein [Weeksellaceae bacterium]|nr:thioredoxin family protein [Weeksellaceae bacterium]
MKTIIVAVLMALFSNVLVAQTRLEDAKKQAGEKKELILLNFSGSDWCIPCIKLHKNIIETEEFKSLTTENIIVYLNADFPRSKKNQPAPELKKENAALAELYNPKGLFPYTLLLDADGKILKSWEGLPSENAATFCQEIREIKGNLN